MILHVTTPAAWQAALAAGYYEASSLHQQGFIHCCEPHQLQGVLERYYAAAQHLLILHIDTGSLAAPVAYEPSPLVNELFPHVYGSINLDAVRTTEHLVR